MVTAIITILAGLLLPALQQARYTAKNIVCVSNPKQVSTGILTYAVDYSGACPAEVSKNTPPTIYNPTTIFKNGEFDMRPGLTPYFGGTMKGVWRCPLAPSNYKDGAVHENGSPRDIDTATYVAYVSYITWCGRPRGGYGIEAYTDAAEGGVRSIT